MRFAKVIVFAIFIGLAFVPIAFSQSLQKLEFKEVKDAPTLIEREKAVIYIRSTVPNIFVNSTNPNYTFRKVRGKEGEWVLRINPSESYMVSIGARGFLSTVPQRFVLRLKEVQVWEVSAVKSDIVIEEGTGKLVVSGTPAGGVIELDYIPTSLKVPGTFERIKSGMHNVRILSDDIYSVPVDYQVVIEPNKTFELKTDDKQEAGFLSINTEGISKLVINESTVIENGIQKFSALPYKNSFNRPHLILKVPIQKKSYIEIHEPNYLTYKDSLEVNNGDTLKVKGERAELIFKDDKFTTVSINKKSFLFSGNVVSNFQYRFKRVGDIYTVYVPTYDVVKVSIQKPFYYPFEDEFTVSAGEEKYYAPDLNPVMTQVRFTSKIDSVNILGSNDWVKDQEVKFDTLGFSNEILNIPIGNYKFKYAKKGYDNEFGELLINSQTIGTVKEINVKMYKSNRLFTWKRFLFLAILGGGGYAAYEFLLKPSPGAEPLVFPNPPSFPTGN